MSLRVRTLLTFAILAVIAACGQTQQPKAAPPPNQVQPPAADDRPLAKVPAAQRANTWKSSPPMTIDAKKNYVATLTTSKGIIVVALDASAAPRTVNNFVFLVNQGFYDGLTFHRVVPGFVIQGGDPLGTGTGGPGYTVPAEIKLPHVEGAIAMARLGDEQNPQRASSGSQFYITLAPTPNLDGAYTAFGHVTSGMDVVKKIQIGDVIQKIVISGQ
jgi:peptidyl-prolyl cis-trans isomerase B (cyclophilin B)